MSGSNDHLDELCINTIRLLAADAVQQAKSGHPGMPLGAAPMAYVLWTRFMRQSSKNPLWLNRDRFVLSAGHGSALLYSVLHLMGYDISLDELRNFRQWGSKTPGHPEVEHHRGIEATTGPLGQGFAMGVGMALAERFLGVKYNRPGFNVMDHHVYAIVSDGDLMEGISSEAASLAGHLGLGKIVYLYDDNHISIEGPTEISFTEDVENRFKAYEWHVQRVNDGNDISAIENAVVNAQKETDRPSLIMVRTHIGFGSPKEDSPSAHGEPLGEEALSITKENFHWPQGARFYIPTNVSHHFQMVIEQAQQSEAAWQTLFHDYQKKFPAEAKELESAFHGDLPSGWDSLIPVFQTDDGPIATRAASGKVLNALAEKVPWILGGSADLAPSNKTLISGEKDQEKATPDGRNFHFGVREHAMGAVLNGMALHGGVIPYGGTFLVFADYMRPAIRLASIMGVPSIFIFTHDSIGVGEDGPTHQPIEHLASLRAMPNMTILRPADANETAAAWRIAIQSTSPVILALTRQKLPVLEPDQFPNIFEGVAKGAYVLSDTGSTPELILIATGSEVALALEAQLKLVNEKGIKTRVVSMPSWELFMKQPQQYRDEVLPPAIKARIAVEAAATFGWHQWVGDGGTVIGLDRFGASAPGSVLMKQFGFTVENVVKQAAALVGK